MEDLINEQVYINGHDCYYILRESLTSVDEILGEDPTSLFQRAYTVQMYIQNPTSWSSGGDILSVYGLQINKQISTIVTRRNFNKWVGEDFRIRPMEGDLVYIPVFKKMFEIKFVEEESEFFVHGKKNPYYYELQLEMFKYSHEDFETGIGNIDKVESDNSYVIDLVMSTGNVPFHDDEVVYQGADLDSATVTAKVKEWDGSNTTLSIYNIKGEFVNGNTVIGVTSGAIWNISNFDDLEDSSEYQYYQNIEIESEANTTVEYSETNPFGVV